MNKFSYFMLIGSILLNGITVYKLVPNQQLQACNSVTKIVKFYDKMPQIEEVKDFKKWI